MNKIIVVEAEDSTEAEDYISSENPAVQAAFLRIKEMHDWMQSLDKHVASLPEMNTMMKTMATGMTTMSSAAQSMADTFKSAEARAATQDERYEKLVTIISANDRVPLKTHYGMMIFFCLIILLGVLYVTKQQINASLTAIEVRQAETQGLVKDAKETVINKVEETTIDRRQDEKANNGQ